MCVCAHVEKILARLNVRAFNGTESKRLLSAERDRVLMVVGPLNGRIYGGPNHFRCHLQTLNVKQ